MAALLLSAACGSQVRSSTSAKSGGGTTGSSTPASGDTTTSTGTTSTGAAATTGRLVVNLVDAPNTDVTGIFVTLSEVDADLADGGSVQVMATPVTFDLLTLQNGNSLPLGSATLPAGDISMIRMIVDASGPNYVTLADGSQSPLSVPSGSESGIKLPGPFTVSPCSTTTMTLDFDGKSSINVHPTGKQNEYLLRPVVRVKQLDTAPASCPSDDAGSATDADAGGDALDAGSADPGDAGAAESVDAGAADDAGSLIGQ